MASIYRRDGSVFWMARFKAPGGGWTARSTKTTNQAEARKLAYLWEGAGATLTLESPTGAQVDKVVRSLWEQFTGKRLELTPLSGYVETWLSNTAKGRSPKTMSRYRKVAEDFVEFLGERAKLDIRSIAGADVQAFVNAEAAAGKGSTTVALNAKILRAIFNAAFRSGLIEKNPAAALELAPIEQEEREPFTVAEVRSLLRKAKGTDWETAVLLGAYGGFRLGDACTLRWECVDLKAGVIEFTPQKTARKKKRLRVPIHPTLQAHLEELAAGQSAPPKPEVCPTLASQPVGGRAGLSRAFMDLMEDARVSNKSTGTREGLGRAFSRKSFHSLRHFAVTTLANLGVAQDVRQKIAGHADQKMTERYSHLADATLRAAVEQMPDVLKKGNK
ncbi:MAG: tyrosine-type recombinase/integrase [Opitutaceae bacterium]|nr:tyrosine-type recombinase/integrase [Opitutaceae bacterium]